MVVPLSLRLPKATADKVRNIAVLEHRTFAETATVLLDEAIKMREVPGVFFMDGATGRRAKLWGGPDVWEVIEPYVLGGRDWSVLRESFPDLSEEVLRTAIGYYERYPEEIDARIARNQSRWD